jgi:hypothetical protein
VLQGRLTQHQITGRIVAMAQKCEHHVIGLPSRQVLGHAEVGRYATREGTPEKPLRALVIQKPGQARIPTCRELSMQE